MHNIPTPGTGSAMHRFRDRYGLLLEWVVMFLMVVLAVEVTLGIVFRMSGSALVWYDEVASVLLAWLTFYGSALASVKRAHIGCPEVVEQFPAALKRVVGIVGQVLVILFFALLGWVGLSIMPVLAGDALVSLPWVPMNVVQSVIPISSALILVAEVMFLIDLIDGRATASASAAVAASEMQSTE
ncbi:TRAP transporter small permease [Polaromonas sp.]|uniref:TRAP transporter small permease n=1 Tax=Polaromonas sp. TaxID=1869339 RepID=UPI003263930B